MRGIIGIGNPGNSYSLNRHNVGFLILDLIANKYSLKFKPSKKDYYIAKGEVNQIPFALIKPTTFVNNSGLAALQFVDEFEISTQDLLVVVDDIHIEEFDFRLRKSGGDGGHNGLSSIIYHLHSDNFPRFRIGIGKNFDDGNQADYVLSDFVDKDLLKLKDAYLLYERILSGFILDGYETALQEYSRIKNQIGTQKNTD